MRSETKTLSAALYELARTVESGDGVTNAAIAEAAERLDEQTVEIARLLARDKQWIEFALAVGKRVECLASTYPDANDHVLRKLMPLNDGEVADLLPVMQDGWTTADYGMWIARAVERAHGIKTPNDSINRDERSEESE